MSAAELPPMIRMLRFLSGVLLLAGCEGCIARHRCVHDPPLARNVPKIVRGQTTGTQILQYFGVPDLEAHGPKVTLHDDSVMGRQRQKTKEALERAEIAAEEYGIGVGRLKADETDFLDEAARLWAYSSIDEDHVAYLYWEESCRGEVMFLPVPLPWINSSLFFGGSDARVRQNKLLVLINKHTGVVDEFGFRQEFDTR